MIPSVLRKGPPLQTGSDTADNMSIVAVWPVGDPWALIGYVPVLALALMIAIATRMILGRSMS